MYEGDLILEPFNKIVQNISFLSSLRRQIYNKRINYREKQKKVCNILLTDGLIFTQRLQINHQAITAVLIILGK